MLPQERLTAFRSQGFFPNGVYLPSNDADRRLVQVALKTIGSIPDESARLQKYLELQETGEAWQARGIPGRWTGQQGVARSKARFRLVAWGRRGGKSLYSAHEGASVAINRPRSWVWICAPTMVLVSRCFDMIDQLLADLGIVCTTRRNTQQHKLLVLPNGSQVEGVSLDNPQSAAGAGVDLAVIDEAAQVEPDAWTRAVLPPLTDRMGYALLISSWEGREGFFFEKAEEAKARQAERGLDSEWDVFQDPSWETNFYLFPQGRSSPAIRDAEREINDPVAFLEQFGAIPSRNRTRVFPEFRERVHVGDYPFNPNHPVIVGADPSGGANQYGILVVQDYKDYLIVIDEFYISAVTSADLSPLMRKKPWAANVTDLVVDSANFTEVEHWARYGWPAYAVPDKPQVEERLPIWHNLLRNPDRYYWLHRQVINRLLDERGLPPDSDHAMSPDEQLALATYAEDALADDKISDHDLELLRSTARVFIDKKCVWTIAEHKLYSYPKQRRSGVSTKEKPVDGWDHLMDCAGYVCWVFHRSEATDPNFNAIRTLVRASEGSTAKTLDLTDDEPEKRPTFLNTMRSRYESKSREPRSLVGAGTRRIGRR